LLAGCRAVNPDSLQRAERREAMRRTFRLPASSEQAHHPRVLARQVFRADGRCAGDAKLLQVSVVDDRQELAGTGAVQINKPAKSSVGTSGYAALENSVALLEVGDDVGVDAIGRHVQFGDGACQRREAV